MKQKEPGFFGKIKKAIGLGGDSPVQKGFTIAADDYKGGAAGMWIFNGAPDGSDLHFSYENINSSLRAYADCPPVAAIVNRKAQAYLNGKTTLLNINGKAGGKEANGEIAAKIKKLLKQPNPIQSWEEFEAQQYIFIQITGYCITVPIKPVGFENMDATMMWNIPPWMLGIIEKPNVNLLLAKNGYKDFISKVFIVWGGLTIPLNLDDIFIFKDFTPSTYSLALPESRIRALRQPINNIIGAYESRNILINRRGALGILSNSGKDSMGQIPLDPEEKKSLQDDYNKFGLRSRQWQVIITNASLQWQQMGFPTKELMLFEEIQDDIQRICDGYGYPYRLLASEKSASYNDVNEFKKSLYQDTIIPESVRIQAQWGAFLNTEKYNLKIDKDFLQVPAMQEDQVQQATARWRRNQGLLIEFQNNVLTLDEWRMHNGDEPLGDPLGNLYYYELIARGIVFGQGQTGSTVPDTQTVENAADNPTANA